MAGFNYWQYLQLFKWHFKEISHDLNFSVAATGFPDFAISKAELILLSVENLVGDQNTESGARLPVGNTWFATYNICDLLDKWFIYLCTSPSSSVKFYNSTYSVELPLLNELSL